MGEKKGTHITKMLAFWMTISNHALKSHFLYMLTQHLANQLDLIQLFHYSFSGLSSCFYFSPISIFFLSLSCCCAAHQRPQKSPRSQADRRDIASVLLLPSQGFELLRDSQLPPKDLQSSRYSPAHTFPSALCWVFLSRMDAKEANPFWQVTSPSCLALWTT